MSGAVHSMGPARIDQNMSCARLRDRRRLLQFSGLGCLGAVLPALGRPDRALGGESPTRPAVAPIKSCILVFHYGGPSHLDTLDPKPLAPAAIRGEYATIPTTVPGTLVSEHLPRLARLMDRIAIVRSMHHRMTNHNAAAAEGLTGKPPPGGDQELLADEALGFPTLGSVVAWGLGSQANVLPYVALPYTIYNVVQIPGQTAGFLGGGYDRFQVADNPSADNFRIRALDLPDGRDGSDILDREQLLRRLDGLTAHEPTARMRQFQQRALMLLSTDSVRRGFDIAAEPTALKDRYGRGLLGQSLLLARRLVENGVNFVTVFDGQTNGQDANWDSHQTIFPRHRQLIPPADAGLSALIDDLEARGLLESTLVVSMGEFGRTPKINSQAGRDHWPNCFSMSMAGGGIQGGAFHGASDAMGAYPARDPVAPADVAATILWRFGIDPAREVHDPTGRPFRLAEGAPLAGLFG